jgi:hypothetical protein
VAATKAVVCNGTVHTTGCSPQRCHWEETVVNVLLPRYDAEPEVRRYLDEVHREMGPFPVRQRGTSELMCRLMHRSPKLQQAWLPHATHIEEVVMAYDAATTAAHVIRRLDILLVLEVLTEADKLAEHVELVPADALRGCVGALNCMRMSLMRPVVAEAFVAAWRLNRLPMDAVYEWQIGDVVAAMSSRALLSEAVLLSLAPVLLPAFFPPLCPVFLPPGREGGSERSVLERQGGG